MEGGRNKRMRKLLGGFGRIVGATARSKEPPCFNLFPVIAPEQHNDDGGDDGGDGDYGGDDDDHHHHDQGNVEGFTVLYFDSNYCSRATQ